MKACCNRSFSQQHRCCSSSSRSSVGRRSPCRAPPRAQARRAARRRRNAAARPLRRPSRTPATLRRAATLRAAPSRRRPSWRRQQWRASATRTDASCRRIAATRSTPTDRSAGVTLAAIARPRDGAKRSPQTAAHAIRSASNFSPRPPYAEEGCRTTIFSYGGIARETVAQERQPGTPVGKEKIVATVCIFIGGDPGTASGR